MTNDTVMNVDFTKSDYKEFMGPLDPSKETAAVPDGEVNAPEKDEEENLILDLDNNTIVSSNPKSSINVVVSEESVPLPDILIIDSPQPPRPSTSTRSKIVITKINKPAS